MPRGKKKIDESVKVSEENMTPEIVTETAAPKTDTPEESVTETKAVPEKKARKPRAKKTVENAAESASKEKPVKTGRKRNTSPESVTIQSGGNDYSMSDIIDLCKSAYRGGTKKQIKTISVYVKPENDILRAYYVVNGKADGAFIDL